MKTTAAVAYEVDTPLTIESLELDDPREGEVLIRIESAGLCHSDHHYMSGFRKTRMPVVLGHEGAGVVEAVGPGVTSLKVGDAVIQSFIAVCHHCRQCQRRRFTHCESGLDESKLGAREGSMIDGSFRLRNSRGDQVGSGSRLASFSRLTVSPANALIPFEPDISFDVAAIMGCGVLTGIGASLNAAQVIPGDSVVIFGAGGVGLAAVQGAIIGGAGQVVVVDVKSNKRDFAVDLGATHFVDASQVDPTEEIRHITGGRGVDKALICIDHVTGEHLAAAVEVTGANGITVLVGAPAVEQMSIPVQPAAMMRWQKTIRATLYGGNDPHGDATKYLDLYRNGRLALDKFITARYPLNEINAGFDDLLQGKNIRGVVDMAAG